MISTILNSQPVKETLGRLFLTALAGTLGASIAGAVVQEGMNAIMSHRGKKAQGENDRCQHCENCQCGAESPPEPPQPVRKARGKKKAG